MDQRFFDESDGQFLLKEFTRHLIGQVTSTVETCQKNEENSTKRFKELEEKYNELNLQVNSLLNTRKHTNTWSDRIINAVLAIIAGVITSYIMSRGAM